MALMQNVRQRGSKGTYYVVQNIPAAARSAFEGKAQVWVSLRTTDKSEARSKAVAILADMGSRIQAAQMTAAAIAQPVQLTASRVPINRPHAIAAIDRWRVAATDADYHSTVNGLDLPPRILTGAERAALQTNDFGAVAEFRPLMVAALASQGIVADVDHPALDFLSEAFAVAILSVEHWRERFGLRLIDGWPEADDVSEPKAVNQAVQAAPQAGMKISQLRDAWDAVKPLESRQKGYIKRLIEFLGDLDIATVEPLDMDRFLIDLKAFPMIRKPIDDIPFGQLVGAFPNAPRLHVMTVWKWTTVYKTMFDFAVSRRLLSHNPAEAMMRKPGVEARTEKDPFDAADMNLIFATPTFTGHTGRRDGYRDKPGEVVTKDDFYWLIVLAAATGMRLEEMASLKRSEVIREGELVGLDLTARPIGGPDGVKNSGSRRIVPVSKALTETGFVDWLDQGKGEFVFASLKADAKGDRGTAFGKWFARWSTANAPVKGSGIDAPQKSLHSFRHTFKLAARVSGAKEEIHNLITGHNDGNVVARGYGRGADRRGVGLATLKRAVDMIEIPGLDLIRP